MTRYWSKKVDANQGRIVDELKRLGYKVALTHRLGQGMPDIVVANQERMVWVEIKTFGQGLTDDETDFFREWSGCPIMIAFTARDVVKWFGDPRWVDVND